MTKKLKDIPRPSNCLRFPPCNYTFSLGTPTTLLLHSSTMQYASQWLEPDARSDKMQNTMHYKMQPWVDLGRAANVHLQSPSEIHRKTAIGWWWDWSLHWWALCVQPNCSLRQDTANVFSMKSSTIALSLSDLYLWFQTQCSTSS